jgi:plastocyanin
MTSRPTHVQAITIVVLLLTGCGGQPAGPSGPPPPPTMTNAIDVSDNFFSPVGAAVGSQATVTWTWRGSNGHNVTFEDGRSSSSTMTQGSHQRTFAAPGTFRYRCTIHSTGFDNGMVGSILVQ